MRTLLASRATRLLLATGLLLALGWVLFVAWQYVQTRKPISDVPGVPDVAFLRARQQPSFVQSFYGDPSLPLMAPGGLAVSPTGDRLYATVTGGLRTTVVFDRQGRPIGQLVPPDTAPGGRYPLYVAVDPAGNIYISDRLRAVIDMYSPDGQYLGTYQPQGDRPVAPMALAFDKDGNFYVTDVPQDYHRLLVYDQAGALRLSVGQEGTGPREFSFPNGVAVGPKGTIYVADSNNGRVQILDENGELLDAIGRGARGTLGNPRGLAVDSLQRLFIVDIVAQAVEVWDVSSEPKRLHAIGGAGAGDGQFSAPSAIALDSTGRVYVADRGNNRVNAWSY